MRLLFAAECELPPKGYFMHRPGAIDYRPHIFCLFKMREIAIDELNLHDAAKVETA